MTEIRSVLYCSLFAYKVTLGIGKYVEQSFTSIALLAYDLYKRLDHYLEGSEYSLMQDTMVAIYLFPDL